MSPKRRCTVPVGVTPVATRGIPCKNRCVNPNAFCDTFAKKCTAVVDGKTSCKGYGTQGTCAAGQVSAAIARYVGRRVCCQMPNAHVTKCL